MNQKTGLEIAVVGMSGRFPGARNIEEFWDNLKKGINSIVKPSEEELREAGISPDLRNDPGFVKTKGGFLDKKEYFDALFFDYTPAEAAVMDPQLRFLHECVWEVLEDSGYNPYTYEGAIGFCCGGSPNFNWEALTILSEKQSETGGMLSSQLIDRGYFCTRISYKFDFKGPSFTIQTACSTSLVAVHLSCQLLLNGECDMAVAGGVSISSQKSVGYRYQEGIILSPDGQCRAFDAEAKGTISGDGVGLVVLKPLESALIDGDHIYAVIKGTAINNDGLRKVGYSAPSREAQTEAIKMALYVAEISPEKVSYIEAHGTGTPLGDPIEIEALKQAFNTDKKRFCAIGSVKTNVGHLDAAAGVTGLIKVILSLKHRLIPPSLNFKKPNPKIDFENSPFYVNTELQEWECDGEPLHAGVSSFGIGGTNAHVVLEEAPQDNVDTRESRSCQLFLLSAKTESALEEMKKNLAHFLERSPGLDLADVAYTLQAGRRVFPHRFSLSCSDKEETIGLLTSEESVKTHSFFSKQENPIVVFMFPGQGSQYENMGRDLYQTERVFREEVNKCFKYLEELNVLDSNIKESLFSQYTSVSPKRPDKEIQASGNRDIENVEAILGLPPQTDLNQTCVTQPALFILEYALASLLMNWGIHPYALIGHSIGEYVAACLSGVFSLQDALKLVVMRGQLMQQMAPGAMLSIALSEDHLSTRLSPYSQLSLAAVNHPVGCVVSGPAKAIDAFKRELEQEKIQVRKLFTSHAFHSAMMEPLLESFKAEVESAQLNAPEIPYVSNLTGKWVSVEEATDSEYWLRHLREAVRFGDGVQELLKNSDALFLEVGPGKTLSAFVRQHPDKKDSHQILNLLRHPKEKVKDNEYLMDRLGRLWLLGKSMNGSSFYTHEERRRISLPTYPFERNRYWMENQEVRTGLERLKRTSGTNKNRDISEWFYLPFWKVSSLQSIREKSPHDDSYWIVFTDDCLFSQQLTTRIKETSRKLMLVRPGNEYSKISDCEYRIRINTPEDYRLLFKELNSKKIKLTKILHLLTIDQKQKNNSEVQVIPGKMDVSYYSLLNIGKALSETNSNDTISLYMISNNMQKVTGCDDIFPWKSALLGPLKVLPNEYSNLKCVSIDISLPDSTLQEMKPAIQQVFWELQGDSTDRIISYRGQDRLLPVYGKTRIEKTDEPCPRLKKEGVYLITGGMGGIGLVMAEFLAKNYQAKLVLISRSEFPARTEWEPWKQNHKKKDRTLVKIQQVEKLEAFGAEVLVFSTDVSNHQQMKEVLSQVISRFGSVNGVIHAAGVADGALIHRRTTEQSEQVLLPKIKGTLVLDRVLEGVDLDFFMLCSSISSILGPLGQVAYVSANAFLDAFAQDRNSRGNGFTVSINWDTWEQVGMAVEAREKLSETYGGSTPDHWAHGIEPPEGIDLFVRALEHTFPQVVTCTRDLHQLISKSQESSSVGGLKKRSVNLKEGNKKESGKIPRPMLSSTYKEPGNETEVRVLQLFEKFFGIEKLGIYDDFFELGGDSLKALILISKIQTKFQTKISLSDFFNGAHAKNISEIIQKTNFNDEDDIPDTLPTEDKEYYQLSSAQKGIYLFCYLNPKSLSYNMPKMFMLEGDLNKEVLDETFKKMVKRHESFRTSFELVEGEPVQRIHQEVGFQVEFRDLKLDRPEEFDPGNVVSDFVKPFDLSKAPLLRLGLIKLGEGKYFLMSDMNHIVADGASVVLIMKEFMQLYQGEELPKLNMQYRDFSEWRCSPKYREILQKQEKYWLKKFDREIPVLNLPLDYPRPESRSSEGDNVHFIIDSNLAEGLRVLAKRESVTMYIMVLTIFYVLLSKLSGQEDIALGTVTEGRKSNALRSVIGMFVNTLVLRSFPEGSKTFLEYLREVKGNTLEAFDNEDIQFEDLVEMVVKDREPGRNPLFDVMFLLENTEFPKFEIPGLSLTLFRFRRGVTKFDLTVLCFEYENTLCFGIEFDTALFKKETIERFKKYIEDIIIVVTENNEIQLGDIRLSHGFFDQKLMIPDHNEESFDFGWLTPHPRCFWFSYSSQKFINSMK
jgi:acyl transferase domain-containing protein/acyl carrier protein